MKAGFLTSEQVFSERGLGLFARIDALAKATDFALALSDDDGFFTEGGSYVNYYLHNGGTVSRFGKAENCELAAVRPAILLEPEETAGLQNLREENGVVLCEFGEYPQMVIDESLREMAEHDLPAGVLAPSGKSYTLPGGKTAAEVLMNGKKLVAVPVSTNLTLGFLQLSSGLCRTYGEPVTLEVRPVTWYYDAAAQLLVARDAITAGFSYEAAAAYLAGDFLKELRVTEMEEAEAYPFRYEEHDELDIVRAYLKANIPVFLHGLSGDGKSDRVRQIDPQALDIELVNENPESINGKAIYNEAKDEIREIKPVWLVHLEKLCEDGKPHVLFFDELTNATKQTQSVIFKIVLERIVNNRWKLPENARIIAAGNDRAESTVSHDLAEPLFGRFAHVYIRTTMENWMPWAVKNKLNPYVLEFLANNDLYLRTPYTGTEPNADPRRWELASRVLDSSGNDFALLPAIVGREPADAFLKFFKAQRQLTALGNYTDAELARFSTARKYQIAQQCLNLAPAKPDEARAMVERLGSEFLAWFDYVWGRKTAERG